MDNSRVWFLNREMKGVRREDFSVVNQPYFMSFATDGVMWFKQDWKITEAEFKKEVKAVANRNSKMISKLLK